MLDLNNSTLQNTPYSVSDINMISMLYSHMLKVLLTSKGPYFEFICVTMPGLELVSHSQTAIFSSPTPIAVEASTAFSMGGVPDPIFSRPNIKEKIAVWLRETSLEPPLEEWLRAWFCKKNSMDCEMIITHYVLFWDHQMLNISMTVEIECSSKITS